MAKQWVIAGQFSTRYKALDHAKSLRQSGWVTTVGKEGKVWIVRKAGTVRRHLVGFPTLGIK